LQTAPTAGFSLSDIRIFGCHNIHDKSGYPDNGYPDMQTLAVDETTHVSQMADGTLSLQVPAAQHASSSVPQICVVLHFSIRRQ